MEDKFYIRIRNKPSGPFDFARLRNMISRGQFGRHYEISEDKEIWHQAGDFPELFEPQIPPKMREGQYAPQAAGGQYSSDYGGYADQAVEADTYSLQESASYSASPTSTQPYWMYTQNLEQIDTPVSFGQLQQLCRSGQVGADEYVWCEGMAEWASADSIPGLFS